VLCYGDSLTIGYFNNGRSFEPYGRTLARTLSSLGVHCEVSVCGFIGLTAQQLLTNADSETLKDVIGCQGMGLRKLLNDNRTFDVVLIMAGTNDLGNKRQTPKAILENIQGLHEICHASKIPTIALAPPPAKQVPSEWNHKQHELCSLVLDWANTSPSMPVAVDVGGIVPINGVERTTHCYWDTDGLHFSGAGSKQLGASLASVVAGLRSGRRDA